MIVVRKTKGAAGGDGSPKLWGIFRSRSPPTSTSSAPRGPDRIGPRCCAASRLALPAEFRDNPTWTIALNSHGYRNTEFVAAKPASTVRIACVGDSWTFGMNIDQDRTYPARLAAWLHEAHPDATFDVQNFGVLGYSSFQGLQLLSSLAF